MSDTERQPIALREWFFPSNLLTLARLLMLPALLRALLRREGRFEALGLLGAAMATDLIDGPIARRRGEVSELGKVLDPIADKLTIDTTAFVLTLTRGFPWWATALLLARDAAILSGSAAIYRRHTAIATAGIAGKATTAALTTSLLLYIADGPRSGRPVLYLALVPFLFSILAYGWRFLRSLAKHG
ncbi:MAG TPA: CDP-alcohol phosphatidyltransferase family protein [Roseiflexaceae bacterium]|nr:CDP-alcohol phosphatidyltransferase family protein [Roseiflexaceae bacterium]HMP42942.1 CDP-alcohol phosphatidyltransferase family protein [Roseiflexaceae bacterium]